jgi:ATP-binding cassette subfamily F protein uup
MGLSFEGKVLFRDLDILVMRGDRIALVGPNGVGKTSLIKALLGDYPLDSGSVRQGTNLEVAYFDQHRMALDLDATVQDNVAEGRQDITLGGQTRHVLSYLGDFLFSPQRARTPVRALSGGEKNRLLLAKLFAKPSNLLILDEPTNDLDVETLELLEEILEQYQGTVLLVSHDREFVNNTVTSSLWFAGDGKVVDISGGYDDVIAYQQYLAQLDANKTSAKVQNNVKPEKQNAPVSSASSAKKLSYKEKRELEQLPALIESLDAEIGTLQAQVNSPEFFRQTSDVTSAILNQLHDAESKLAHAYERWELLEALNQQ